MKNNRPGGLRRLLCTSFLLVPGLAAAAPADRLPGFYLDLGQAMRGGTDTASESVGAVLPWRPGGATLPEGALSFYWDAFLGQWRAPQPSGAGRRNYTQLGLIGNLRWRFAAGTSPWFVEAGVGVTVMDDIYRTPERNFSTTFQFTQQLGVGRSFGAQGAHELTLRLQHFSNAGIKEPNPGENFVRLRYLYRF